MTDAAMADLIIAKMEECAGNTVLLRREVLLILASARELNRAAAQASIEKQVASFIGAKRIEGLSEKTLRNYQLYLMKFAKTTDKSIQRVNADDIRQFVASLQLSENSVITIINTLRSFFTWLSREEVIKKNPMLKIPSNRKPRKRLRHALSPENTERYRSACQTIREQALVEFFLSTGCRVAEVARLNVSDLNLQERSARVLGKGDKERMVYFSVRCKMLLQLYLSTRNGGEALFCNQRRPCNRMSVRSMQKLIKAIGERGALEENIHTHKLRYTFATTALNNGMPITAIQQLLGHAQLTTTQLYAEISHSNIRYEYERCVA